MSLSELCDHLEEVHHGDLLEALAEVRGVLDELAASGARGQCFESLREPFNAFAVLMEAHLETERRLYERLRRFTGGSAIQLDWNRDEFEAMRREHAEADEALDLFLTKVESCTRTGADPENARWKRLQEALLKLNQCVHQQIFEENQILYRRAAAVR